MKHAALFVLALTALHLLPADEVKTSKEPNLLRFCIASDKPKEGWRGLQVRDSDEELYISDSTVVDGTHVKTVTFAKDLTGAPLVRVEFTTAGAIRLREATASNVGRKLAVVLGEDIVMAPVIREAIGAESQLSGQFDRDDLLAIFHAVVLHSLPQESNESPR